MKLLKITTCYLSYVRDFYRKRPDLDGKTFAEQKAAFDYDAFGWADFWSHALTPLGYEVMELSYNVEQMQRAWGRENLLPDPEKSDLKEIVIAQAKRFKPDVVWFDDMNGELLKRIRAEVPSIRLVLGWVGSAIPCSDVWPHLDLILSCAPESVAYWQDKGLSAAHLHHGFDPRINGRLNERPKCIDFSFIGQLMRGSTYHLLREEMLEKLAAVSQIEIYSPSANYGWKDDMEALLLAVIYDARNALRKIGFSESTLKSMPILNKAYKREFRPCLPVNRALKPYLKSPVFGLGMYQVIRDSRVTLNIHSDSSPRFASNMRLFETTGVGTCLVTDWKENLHELFDVDKEIVAYKSVDECMDKVTWLLNHPEERERIASAGHARIVKEHTFAHRAVLLDDIIKTRI